MAELEGEGSAKTLGYESDLKKAKQSGRNENLFYTMELGKRTTAQLSFYSPRNNH